MAVRYEGEHAEFLSKRERLLEVVFGLLDLRGLVLCGDRGEEPEGPCLMSPLSVFTAMLEGTSGSLHGLLEAPCQSIALAQPGNPQRLVDCSDGGAPLYRLLQQR